MTKKLYGSLINRLYEGQKAKEIKEDMDITMYYYTDRTCYFVTKVIDQKHIFVKPYYVCADHDKDGGMGSQDWKFFKTTKQFYDYLVEKSNIMPIINENQEEEWVLRYNNWHKVTHLPDGTKRYDKLQKISFGVKDYYYDWEF